jgi:hypothetical protein
MPNIKELNKLFVRVASNSNVDIATIVTTSQNQANYKKIYFVEDQHTIVNNGVKYGLDPSTAEDIENLQALIGADKLGTEGIDASTILDRIRGLETIHSGTPNYLVVDNGNGNVMNPSIGAVIVDIESGSAGLVDAINAKTYIDASVKRATTVVETGTGLKVDDATDGTDGHTTYTVSPDFKIAYVPAAGNVAAQIVLSSNDDVSTFGTVAVTDIIGNGFLADSSYNASNGMLNLVFNQGGLPKSYAINLHDMLDINDMSIDADSSKYLSIALDSTAAEDGKSQAVISALTRDVSTATENTTGIADAWETKKYVDAKVADLTTDLEVTGLGDAYINLVQDDANNKQLDASAKIVAVTGTAGTVGTYTVADDGTVTTAGQTAPTLTVENASGLLDGKQAIDAVKNYVDDKLAIETARTNAEIEGAIKALDSEDSGKGTNVSVDVSIIDGKLSDVSVVEDYATITYTAHNDATDPDTLANYVVTSGHESKLVKASDLANLKSYTDDKIAENRESLGITAAGDNYINVLVPADDNKHLDVSADVQTLTVTAGTAGVYNAEGE